MRLFHLERLLCLGNALALARDPSLQQLEGLLHLRHLGLFLGQPGPRSLQVLARLLEFRLPGFCRFPQLGVVLPPGVALRPQLGKLRFEALARVGHEANFRFQPRYVRVGPIELALRGAEAVARRVMVAAGLIELALDLPQPRRLRLELRRPALDVARVSLRFGIGFVAAQKPQQVLFERPLGRKLVIPAGDLRLLFEPLDLAPELLADVAGARQILARIGQAMLGLAPPLLVLGHPGRLLEEHAQLLGLRLDDPGDHALLDDGVGPRAQPGAEEDVLHVAAPHVRAVDEVGRLTVVPQYPLHRDLGILGPLPCRPAEAVVEEELHACARHGLAQRRAVENDVLHRVAAQGGGARLSEHPAHGVDDVRLAAAVRPDHADELAGNVYRGGIDEGLEAGELDLNRLLAGSIVEKTKHI